MPLFDNAVYLIRANLEEIAHGGKARAVEIGRLAQAQLDVINAERQSRSTPLEPIAPEVVFIGKHVYQSRCVRDGYTIDDVVDQIMSALSLDSIVIASPMMTSLESPMLRRDRYGNDVRDRAVLECTTRHPRPELYSVMPKGDKNKPPKPP